MLLVLLVLLAILLAPLATGTMSVPMWGAKKTLPWVT